MTNGDLIPQDRMAWFAEMLTEMDSAVAETEWLALTQADPRALHRAFQGLSDFVDLLRTEGEVLHSLFGELAHLVHTLRAQRDEAMAERDIAADSYRDAYLHGLLTREEAYIGEWSAFAVDTSFSLSWLLEVLSAAGEGEAADKVAWVMRNLGEVLGLERLHQHKRRLALDEDPTV